ncbi:MAG TPA: amidohydrolase family protein [Chitinophagaceae bacterium]|nr:amidohydrolase family protein [Chitinophagaceae bacterium]
MKIDAHQHFWKYNPLQHAWINDEMRMIQKDFMPQDLQPVLQQNNIDGCVLVQVDQTEEENIFLLNNAAQFDFIKGVVGWVDLQSPNITEGLEYYQQYKKMKGFRHILQGETQRDFMLRPAFMSGISLLSKYNFTYDILIFPDQLQYALQFVKAFPHQRFVIDHIAKPYIKDKKIDDWKRDMLQFKFFENVYCKISGMVTEADWQNWKYEDFVPYLDVVVESFGTDRIMFGSDWPVCLVAASYERMLGIVKKYFSSFSKGEQQKFFGDNAMKFYNLYS